MDSKLVAELEAFLFIYGDPVSYNKAASVLKSDEVAVKAAATALKTELGREGRGLFLVENGDQIQLCTRPEFSRFLEGIVKDEFSENLTPAALETLTIVAYASPVTRAEIDYIRGVNSSFILRALLIRGLIERSTDEKRGNAYIYIPSFELLKHLGVSQTGELPEFEKFRDLVKKMNEPRAAAEDNQV